MSFSVVVSGSGASVISSSSTGACGSGSGSGLAVSSVVTDSDSSWEGSSMIFSESFGLGSGSAWTEIWKNRK